MFTRMIGHRSRSFTRSFIRTTSTSKGIPFQSRTRILPAEIRILLGTPLNMPVRFGQNDVVHYLHGHLWLLWPPLDPSSPKHPSMMQMGKVVEATVLFRSEDVGPRS